MSHNAAHAMVEREMFSAYPIEIQCPDISRARAGDAGVDFVHRLESVTPGPVVMLNALTHGNEYSGAEALLRLPGTISRPLPHIRQGRVFVEIFSCLPADSRIISNAGTARYLFHALAYL